MSDIDARYTYSPVRSACVNGNGILYSIYPNPAPGFTWLNSTSVLAESMTISVLDNNNGRELGRKNYVVTGAAPAKINLGNITPGMYFLKIVSARGSSTQKLIVQ